MFSESNKLVVLADAILKQVQNDVRVFLRAILSKKAFPVIGVPGKA
tara:strand:+ start:248 stop:385 length:138 start_codon:yes stop_codon:yes gene_type:complete